MVILLAAGLHLGSGHCQLQGTLWCRETGAAAAPGGWPSPEAWFCELEGLGKGAPRLDKSAANMVDWLFPQKNNRGSGNWSGAQLMQRREKSCHSLLFGNVLKAMFSLVVHLSFVSGGK